MDSSEIRPVFIVGMNGSGTTMLADCLNHHPQIYILKVETRIIPYYYFNIRKFGDLKDENNFKAFLKDFSNNYAFRACNDGVPVQIPLDFGDLKKTDLSTAIDLTFSHFASRENKPIWGDHSPKYAAFIPELINLFPMAKVLHIIRDGRDCAQSFKRRFGQNIYRTIHNWKKLVEKARKDASAAGKERYFEIKYEDLTEFPEARMKEICSFFEIPFDDRVLISNMPMFNEHVGRRAGQGLQKILRNSCKWRTAFTNKQIYKLEAIAGQTLASLGYEVAFTLGDAGIPNLQLFILKCLDKINASIAFYKRYKGPHKAGTFIRGVRTSLKQTMFYG